MATTDDVTADPESPVAVSPSPADPESPVAVSPSPEEHHDLTPISDRPSNASPSEHLETLLRTVPTLPPVAIHSAAGLKDLYGAIESFQQCYEDLHKHMDAIKAAILTNLSSETTQITNRAPSSSSPKLDYPKLDDPKPDVFEETPLPVQQSETESAASELETLCKTMCSRGIRKYLSTHLLNLSRVREEVPKALKLAPKPLKLVLECLGKFYLQGSKAYTKNSPMIPAREASIMILECFLLIDDSNGVDNGVFSIDKGVKVEADKAAVAWRKRVVVEGGLAKANQIDARGLLLFVACFGIPESFKRDDIRDLVVAAACSKEVMDALRKSRVLMNKIPEIVEGMLKNKMEVDAVNLIYTFGLEDRFNPQNILVSYLQESKESWKRPKKTQQGSVPASLNDANKRQLASLRSIRRCLERHKIDLASLLPGWQLNEKITTLEKEIGDTDRKFGDKAAQKRKVGEIEAFKKPKAHDPKRPRYLAHGGPQQPNLVGHSDDRRSFLSNHHHNNYPSSTPILYGGPGAGLLPESMIQSGVGPSGMLSSVQYSGLRHGGVILDTGRQVISHSANPYGWNRDSAINERYAGGQPSSVALTNLYRGSSSVEGYGGIANVSALGVGSRASDIYQYADSAVEGESYPGGGSLPSGGAAANPGPAQYPTSYLYQA